eukprot:NODE_744_length_4636_cov_0.275033.p3 type:complete len:195 gc:universal NODE_744_length_4636_cov_0.275033:297-881(+)
MDSVDPLQYSIAHLLKNTCTELTHIDSQALNIVVNLFTQYIIEFAETLQLNTNIGHRTKPDMLDLRKTLINYTNVRDLMNHLHATLPLSRRKFKFANKEHFAKIIPLLPCKKPQIYPHLPPWPSEHTFQHTPLFQPFVHTPISVRIQGSKELTKQTVSLNKMNKKILARDMRADTMHNQNYWKMKAKTSTILEI